MSVQLKSVENRCRRAAQRRGYVLTKDRQRDPLGTRYGTWYVHRDGALVRTFASVGELAEWMGFGS